MALVVRATSNSSFKIVPYLNGYKSFMINDNKTFDIMHFKNSNIGIGTDNPEERFEIKNGILKISNENANSFIKINYNQLSFQNADSSRLGFIGIQNNSNYIQMINETTMKGFSFNGEVLINEIRPDIDKWHRSMDGNPRVYFSSNYM